MKKLRKRHSGEGYIDVCVLVVCAMLVLALAVRILPVFVAKQQLDTYAVELVREVEISGRVGTETSRRAAALTDSTGLDPNIRWSKTGRIQLNEEVTVTLTLDMDIGLFGGFGSFPITLRSEATGIGNEQALFPSPPPRRGHPNDPRHRAGPADAFLHGRGVQPGVDHRPRCQGGCPTGGHLHHQRQL